MQNKTVFASLMFLIMMIAGCLGEDNDSGNQPSVSDEPTSSVSQGLINGHSRKLPNIMRIKDRAARAGITNFFPLAMIAENETYISQCANDHSLSPTDSCTNVGPSNDSDCPVSRGGVLGGAYDPGKCPGKLGGIGMFQLDTGDYNKTKSDWLLRGYDVMTTNGNIDAAISFIIDKFAFHCSNEIRTFVNRADFLNWLNHQVAYANAEFGKFLFAEVGCYQGTKRTDPNFLTLASTYMAKAQMLHDFPDYRSLW